MNKGRKNYDNIFMYFKKVDGDIEQFLRPLGFGAFGEVREVRISSKIYAAKLTEKEKSDYLEPEKLRGPNIIKIVKVSEREIEKKFYDLIIMEKAVLRDIGTLIKYLIEKNLLKLINNPFVEIIGNNILRFFTRQLISGLETLERNEFVHFDIKPENLLIISGLILKISDFSFLRNLKHSKEDFKIPGGTPGYVSPEYYKKEKINVEIAKKQDYFALGATIYFLKFGHRLLSYKREPDNKINEGRIVDLLQRKIPLIESNLILEKDFIEFLLGLISYLPEDRPNFEEIFRNKWLNENVKEIGDIINSFSEGEEDKLMRELVKSDFLIDKKRELNKTVKPKFKLVIPKKF